jgi:hypothetical protein
MKIRMGKLRIWPLDSDINFSLTLQNFSKSSGDVLVSNQTGGRGRKLTLRKPAPELR